MTPALRLPALRLPALRLPALRLPALRLPAPRAGRARRALARVAPSLLAAALACFGAASLAASPPAVAPQASELAEAQRLIGAGDLAAAERILERVVEEHPDSGPGWLLLGYAIHGQGRHEEALAMHVEAAAFPQVAATALYNAACACALLERPEEAFEWLAKARAAGFVDRGTMVSDPDLASLVADPRFARLLPPIPRGNAAFVEDVRVIHAFEGDTAGEQFGWVGRNLGDLDGDGAADFALTAPTRSDGGPPRGRLDVYSGKSGALLWRVDGGPGEMLGSSVAPAGDVDGDGTGDVIVGAPSYAGGTSAGAAYVLSGAKGERLLALRGEAVGDQFGVAVHGVGDVDGDGHADVAAGASTFDGAAGADCGAVAIFAGADGRRLARLEGERAGDHFGLALAASADADRLMAVGAPNAGDGRRGSVTVWELGADGPTERFRIAPSATGAQLGHYFTAFPGDLDGDGTVDVFASDWGDSRGGRVVVHSGATGELLLELFGPTAGENFGTSIAVAGDVDGDGAGDLIVGAWQNAEGGPSAGKCYLHSGRTGALLATYTSTAAGDTLGFDATGLGDVDGDGGVDFLLTAAWSVLVGPRTGRAFVVAGPVFARAPAAPEGGR